MKNGNCDVIVTYCWNRVGYNILRSLASHGLSVWVADTSKNNICSRSRFCSGSFVYPDPFTHEREFIDCLKTYVTKLRPKVLLPTHDESQIVMRHREEFPKELLIPYMSSDFLEKISDKLWATSKARGCGVPVPRVYESCDQVDIFPCVFKTVIGNSAKTVFFPKDRGELEMLSTEFENVRILIEEKIGGADYSVDCVRWNGFFKATTYRAIVTKTAGGGTTTQRVMVSVPKLEEYSKMLLEYVDYVGVCGLDYRYDPDEGRVAFIEVNARFTGGLATPIAAGFDIPWIIYSLATTGNYDEPIKIKIGTQTKWILGDAITLIGRLLSLNIRWQELRQALTFKGFDCFDDFRNDDPLVILWEMLYYFEKLIKKGKLNP